MQFLAGPRTLRVVRRQNTCSIARRPRTEAYRATGANSSLFFGHILVGFFIFFANEPEVLSLSYVSIVVNITTCFVAPPFHDLQNFLLQISDFICRISTSFCYGSCFTPIAWRMPFLAQDIACHFAVAFDKLIQLLQRVQFTGCCQSLSHHGQRIIYPEFNNRGQEPSTWRFWWLYSHPLACVSRLPAHYQVHSCWACSSTKRRQ
jgi:hypothetical protein